MTYPLGFLNVSQTLSVVSSLYFQLHCTFNLIFLRTNFMQHCPKGIGILFPLPTPQLSHRVIVVKIQETCSSWLCSTDSLEQADSLDQESCSWQELVVFLFRMSFLPQCSPLCPGYSVRPSPTLQSWAARALISHPDTSATTICATNTACAFCLFR